MDGTQQAKATSNQVDAFMNKGKPRSLTDVYTNASNQYKSLNEQVQNSGQQQANDLTVIDGDTVYDNTTGTSFRLQGFDTAESSLNEKAKRLSNSLGIGLDEMMEQGSKGKEQLQELVDSGQLTLDMLSQNATGQDTYGRVLSNVDDVKNKMVASGTAAPTSKLDTVAQNLYRKAQQTHYDVTGETNGVIGDIRDNELDGRGIIDYGSDIAKGVGSSVVRVGSEVLDLFADAITSGNNSYFDELKTGEGADKFVGLDSRHSNFDSEEIYHQYKTGDYAGALTTGILAAPETLASSSGDLLIMGSGLGWLTKGAKAVDNASKARKAFLAVRNVGATNAGLLTWASAKTNTDMEKRAENNEDGEVSMTEVGAGLATNILMGSLEKLAFKNVVGAKQDYVDIVKSLQPTSIAKFTGKALAISGGIVAKGGIEGGQEILQETAEILTHEYGTDKYPEYSSHLREENVKQLVTAGFLGAGMGVGTGSTPHVSRASFIGAEKGYEYLAGKMAKPYNAELNASLTDEEIVRLKSDNEQLKDLLNNHLDSNANALQNIQENMDDDGNVDFNSLKTDVGKAAVTSTYNRLNQEYLEGLDEDSYNKLKDSIYDKLIGIVKRDIVGNLKEGNFDIQEYVDAILPIFENQRDKELFSKQVETFIKTYKVDDAENKKVLYQEMSTAIGASVGNNMNNLASYLTYSNINNNEFSVNHGGDKFVSNLITQAKAANSILEKGLKKAKAMDTILESDINKSNLAKELSNLNKSDLDARLTSLMEENLEYENKEEKRISTEQYQLNKTTIDHINRIKNNRNKIEKDFNIKLREVDTSGPINFTTSFNEKAMVDYINAVNRGMVSEKYPNLESTITNIDKLIDGMLQVGTRLSDKDTSTIRDFLRHVINNGHTSSIPKAEALLEKVVLSSNSEYLSSASSNIDLSVDTEEKKKLEQLDVDEVFDTVVQTKDTQAELSDQDVKIIAKKLGLYDLLCLG